MGCIRKKACVAVVFVMALLCGCGEFKEYKIDYTNYNADVELTCFAEKEENSKLYNLNIVKAQDDYNIKVCCDGVEYEIKFENGSCELVNPKFDGKVIVEGASCFDQLQKEIDFVKFIDGNSLSDGIIKVNEGNIQYVLEFDEAAKMLKTLKIYENNAIIKNYEYKKLNITE